MLCGIADAGRVFLIGFFVNEKGGNSSLTVSFGGSDIYCGMFGQAFAVILRNLQRRLSEAMFIGNRRGKIRF